MQYSQQTLALFENHYNRGDESIPDMFLNRVAPCFSGGNEELAAFLGDALVKEWWIPSSPIISSAIREIEWKDGKPIPKTKLHGQPIACYKTYVPDTVPGLISHMEEVAHLSVAGGGVGGHWSSVRSPDDKSPGPIPFINTIDRIVLAYKQGKTRRAAYSAYMDVSHPQIMEHISIRKPTGGDINRKSLNLHNGVNISDAFMEACINNEPWDLICPHTKKVVDTVNPREILQNIIETRMVTGEPKIAFIDTANRALNPFQKKLGLKIHGSNICNEIFLATNEERTAVCCLSSLNLAKYDEWKDTPLVDYLVEFLDNVIEFFITLAPDELARAKFSASRERSIGIGTLGWHTYLQRKMIPFESALAISATHRIYSDIQKKAIAASERLAKERGEPEDIKGSGRRNAHLMAIAPNANSSMFLNVSPGIEPYFANVYPHRTRVGTHMVINPVLEEMLEGFGMNTEEVIHSIATNRGSVQHLDWLSEEEKAVFKTFEEIDQSWVIEQAAARQQYIDQGQSLNLRFANEVKRSDVLALHIMAWKKGLKGLYYLRHTTGISSALEKEENPIHTKVSVTLKDVLNSEEICIACD